MRGDLGGIVIYEVTEAMIRNTAQFCPLAQRADRRFTPCRKNSAKTKANDVSERGVWIVWRVRCHGFHTLGCDSVECLKLNLLDEAFPRMTMSRTLHGCGL